MNDANLDTEVINFDQDAILSEKPTGIECPTCKKLWRESELFFGAVGECQFAGCKNCGGMLFQQETFALLVAHLRAITPAPVKPPNPMDSAQLSVRRSCPTCDSTFETHSYAGPGNSVIDTCSTCHVIWFDSGELNNLVNAPGRR